MYINMNRKSNCVLKAENLLPKTVGTPKKILQQPASVPGSGLNPGTVRLGGQYPLWLYEQKKAILATPFSPQKGVKYVYKIF